MTLSINIPDHHSDVKNSVQARKQAGCYKFSLGVFTLGLLFGAGSLCPLNYTESFSRGSFRSAAKDDLSLP